MAEREPFGASAAPTNMNGAKTMTNLQKIESIESEVRQKLNPYTPISEHEDLPGPIIGETLTAAERSKVKAIQTEYNLERAAIVAEGEARLADEHNRTQKQDCP